MEPRKLNFTSHLRFDNSPKNRPLAKGRGRLNRSQQPIRFPGLVE